MAAPAVSSLEIMYIDEWQAQVVGKTCSCKTAAWRVFLRVGGWVADIREVMGGNSADLPDPV